jgi:3-deoxy-7-phosphoheptulonate synthase
LIVPILEIQGHNQCVYAILGDETHALMFKRIAGLSFVRKVDAIESPYKLMDRRSALSEHQVQLGISKLGMDSPFIIGGPCTIDPQNPSLFIETAHAVKRGRSKRTEGRSVETKNEILTLIRVTIRQLRSFYRQGRRQAFR